MGIARADRGQPPKSYGAGLEMLMQYNEESQSFFSQTITSDGTWLHFWTLEWESASVVCKMADETALQKFKEKPFAGKLLVTISATIKVFSYSNIARKVLL